MTDKPLTERLQVKGARRLAVIAPPVPAPAIAATAEPDAAEVVLLFAPDRARLDAALARWLPRLRDDAILWLAYPKLSSPLAADLSRDVIRDAAPGHGLDTVGQIAIDADWSALRLKRVR